MIWWLFAVFLIANLGVLGVFNLIARRITASFVQRLISSKPSDKAAQNNAAPRQPHHDRCDLEIVTIILLIATILIVSQRQAQAQAQPNQIELGPVTVKATPIIGGKPSDPCVAVDAAGRHAGDADCAAQKLQDAAKAAQEHTGQGRDTANIPGATSHDTRIGVANQTATKQRLGNNFGKSVLPQRPNVPPPAPSPFSRQ
jgi:hypothetical protein